MHVLHEQNYTNIKCAVVLPFTWFGPNHTHVCTYTYVCRQCTPHMYVCSTYLTVLLHCTHSLSTHQGSYHIPSHIRPHPKGPSHHLPHQGTSEDLPTKSPQNIIAQQAVCYVSQRQPAHSRGALPEIVRILKPSARKTPFTSPMPDPPPTLTHLAAL